MNSAIDVVICLDSTPSMAPAPARVKNLILDIFNTVLTSSPNDSRISLIKFRSCNDDPVTTTCPFTQCRNAFNQCLDSDQPENGSEGGFKAVGDALQEAGKLDWRRNGANGIYQEKLVILITDYAPSNLVTPLFGTSPRLMAKELAKQDIVLVVVDAKSDVAELDDFYFKLSAITGGACIPLINAESMLPSAIKTAVEGADTLRQALVQYPVMGHKVHPMISDCLTMTSIQDVFDNYDIHHP